MGGDAKGGAGRKATRACLGRVRLTVRGRKAMNGRIETLDELRGLAIGAVMLSHFALAFGSQSAIAYWMNVPDFAVGVDLFFVISGYLVLHNIAHLAAAGAFWRGVAAFYVRRLMRIALPAWGVIALLLLANLDKPAASAADLWSAVTFVANIHWGRCERDGGCGDPLAASHFWSLASEAQFYLLAPALLLARGRAAVYAAAALVLLAPLPRPHGSMLWALRPDALLLGAALASEATRGASWLTKTPPATAGMAVWWMIVAAMVARVGSGALSGLAWALVALICAGVVLTRMNASPMGGRAGVATRAIGRASFSIYLVHLPLIGMAAESAAPRIGVAAAVAICLIAITAATTIVELAMVNPARQLGRLLSARLTSQAISFGNFLKRESA